MNLQALRALMGMLDQVLQSIETRRQIWIFGTRLESPQVVGVTSTADLDEQRIQIGGPCPGDEVIHLLWCFEAIVERVDPEGAELGRIHRLSGGPRRGRGRREGQFSRRGHHD